MLLVDDDQPEILDRREHGRAGTDAHTRLPFAQPAPLGVALPGRQPRVQHRDRLAEAFDEAPDDLRREGDLGHEHDRAATLLQRGVRGAQVDLGLARAGHAVQQALLSPARVDRRDQRLQCQPLIVGQLRRMGTARAHLRWRGRATARRLRPLSLRVACGGSTSPSARAIVEQYSAAIHSASATRSTGRAGGPSPARAAARAASPRRPRCCRRGRRQRRAPRGGRTARPASSRRPRLPAARPGADSRRARAARGPSSSARPWRSSPAQAPAPRARGAHPRAGRWWTPPEPRGLPGQSPQAERSASALSVRSHVKSSSSRPKWPYAAVFW